MPGRKVPLKVHLTLPFTEQYCFTFGWSSLAYFFISIWSCYKRLTLALVSGSGTSVTRQLFSKPFWNTTNHSLVNLKNVFKSFRLVISFQSIAWHPLYIGSSAEASAMKNWFVTSPFLLPLTSNEFWKIFTVCDFLAVGRLWKLMLKITHLFV